MESLINEVTELKRKHFDSAVHWYQDHSKTPRILFRATGYMLIFLSVTIPFLTTLTFSGSKILLSVIALLVAALTGINSFAKWDAQWREYKRAQTALEKLDALWDIQLIEARRMQNKDEAQKIVIAATRQLFIDAKGVITAETERFFSNVQLPKS